MNKFDVLRAFIVNALLMCENSLSKKLSVSDFDIKTPGNIDDCQRCKILTNSFLHWFDNTARGKYEGGDAAWEEMKLKSYARSEIRLIEIQEGLCSELKKHKDQCYAIAEEAEQALEIWWFLENQNSMDLYSWLCIENLQHCCPQKHYGHNCDLCLLDVNNNLCGGNGKCDGEGTRKGNGSCLCYRGFTGKHCEDCAKDFYRNGEFCAACHKSCDGCSGGGSSACTHCKSGWQLEAGTCVDNNECVDPFVCQPNQYCVNQEGSYECFACDKACITCLGPGSKNCTSCKSNYLLWSGSCMDEKFINDLLMDAFKKTAVYLSLLLITILVFRTSKLLASITVMAFASYMYFSEKISSMTVIDIFLNFFSIA